MISTNRFWILAAAIIVSAVMHAPHFNKEIISIHAWRQTQTQSNIINFYEEDMNLLNPRRNDRGNGDGIFRMEFPLMQWMVAVAYKLMGPELWLCRLMMFVIGSISIIGMCQFLLAVTRKVELAVMGAWAFTFSPSFYYYMINPLPDNAALCAGIWGLALIVRWKRQQQHSSLVVGALLLSISALCKLPFILFFIFPAYLLFTSDNKHQRRLWIDGLILMFALVLPVLWYMAVIPHWQGNGIVRGILDNKTSFGAISTYMLKNLTSVLPELLINYGALPFFIGGIIMLIKRREFKSEFGKAGLTMGLVLIGYVLFEINVITDVHDYYLFPFYPLLFLAVGYGAYQGYTSGKKWLRITTICLLFILPLTAWARMKDRWDERSPGFNVDWLQYKNELQDATPKQALVVAGNDISHYIFFYYIDRRGWGFDSDRLEPAWLADMISKGASFLYSDTRQIDEHPLFQPMLDSLVLERGTVRVYKLK